MGTEGTFSPPQNRRKGGRPTKYSRDRIEAILRSIRNGAGRSAAACAAGVSVRTLENWIAGKARFAEQVMQADAEAVGDAEHRVWRDNPARWLESKRPAEWGRRAPHVHEGAERPIEFIIVTEQLPRTDVGGQHPLLTAEQGQPALSANSTTGRN